MGEPCYNGSCSLVNSVTRTTGKCDCSPDCTEFISYEAVMNRFGSSPTQKSNRTSNLPCHNDNCYAVSKMKKMTGCVFSDTCPDFMAVGFGSAKKKTNFDHIKEMSVDEFINLVSKQACPPGSGNCEPVRDLPCKTCQSCWKSWLESEYHKEAK